MSEKYLIGFSTNDSEEETTLIAKTLVKEKLAACVNIVPELRSIYSWKNQICDEKEFLSIIKTTENNKETVIKRIKELHHYEVPEIIFLEIKDGLPEYLKWIEKNIHS